MSDIVLSAGVRQNLLSLQSTAQLMSQTQNRLATGKKVNTALDNPTNYFTSSALQSRSKDFGALLDSMSNGIKVLEAASNGITAINRTIESMQSTLRQARQDKSFQSTSYTLAALDTSTVQTLSFDGGAVGTAPITINLNTADVGGSKTTATSAAVYSAPTATQAVLTGGAFTGLGAGETIDFDVNGQTIHLTNANANDVNAARTAIQDQLNTLLGVNNFTVSVNGSAGITIEGKPDGSNNVNISNVVVGGGAVAGDLGFAAGNHLGDTGAVTFTINGTAVTLTTADNTITKAIATINAALGPSSAFQAVPDGAGTSIIMQAKNNGTQTLAFGGTDAAFWGAVTQGTAPATAGVAKTVDQLVSEINNTNGLSGKVRASNDNGKLRVENLSTQVLNLSGVNAVGGTITGGTGAGTIAGNEVRKNFADQFNSFIDQLNKLADDASYNGINLLRGDKLKITFNENGSSTIEVQAKDAQGNPTSINTNTLKITQAQAPEFDSDNAIDGRLQVLTNALGQLRSQASAFGSNLSVVQNRQDFTKTMINTLQTGADSLVLADTNEEGANMLALQTRQQLSTTALSLSAQADQAVLRLFG
ncbi:flagellin [Xanthobacteraceae bacterium Astr-EGSB]|uniref:flagellin N-terminal helical domain-containing protein n=1 Tax=Astrobacterium formosum TaxID=3069710 RepID=UPI0027ADCF19|nr:flagellin [Xanthobacteraceae bacterium Astr-EGSB]